MEDDATELNVEPPEGAFARLFVPVDLTASSQEALAVALALKRAFGSRVCVFHLVEQGGGDEFIGGLGAPASTSDLVTSAEGRLRRFIEHVAPGTDDSVEVRGFSGVKPIDDIRQEARRWNASLVIAAAAFGGFFRSPAEKLVHRFDIPVLLIPSTPKESRLTILGSPTSLPTPGI